MLNLETDDLIADLENLPEKYEMFDFALLEFLNYML